MNPHDIQYGVVFRDWQTNRAHIVRSGLNLVDAQDLSDALANANTSDKISIDFLWTGHSRHEQEYNKIKNELKIYYVEVSWFPNKSAYFRHIIRHGMTKQEGEDLVKTCQSINKIYDFMCYTEGYVG